MSKKTSAIIIWTLALTLLVLNCIGCGTVKFGGNPDPDMKTVHMMTEHPGYTQADKEAHVNWDCTTYRLEPIYITNKQNGKKVLVAYKRINIQTNKID